MAIKPRPGRPSLERAQDASEGIVNSASLHFAQHGIKGSSYRQIAEEAKVTAAMVHYYFRKKDDLYLAVLEAAFVPLLEVLKGVDDLDIWVTRFHTHLLKRPWLPHLMIREVLSQSGLLRPLFLQHFAPSIFGSIKGMVTQVCRQKSARGSLDVDRHVVLLMGMLVYPFIGMGIAQNLTGRKFDKRMLEGFRDDALALFRHGISNDNGRG